MDKRNLNKFQVQKVVLIMCQPISAKIVDDFYIDGILSAGFEFEYWNIAELLFNRKYEVAENLECETYRCYSFKDLNTIKKHLVTLDLSTTVFIPQITYDFRSFKFFKLISKLNCQCFFFARGVLPSYQSNRAFKKMGNLFNYKLPGKILLKVSNKIKARYLFEKRKQGVVKPYNVLFMAGKHGAEAIGIGYKLDLQKSKIVPINYFDFDTYLPNAGSKKPCDVKRYCVFLDDHLAGHPDFKALGISMVDPISYFNDLNKFFDFVELEFNVKVVVAAHPKSDYTDNPFGGREIVKFSTERLVRQSEFAICHMSTAISFAVLNEKPLLFISSEAIRETMPAYDSYIRFLALYLDSAFCNLSDPVFIKRTIRLVINQETYRKYTYNFLTNKDTENTTTREIFLKFLLSYKTRCHG